MPLEGEALDARVTRGLWITLRLPGDIERGEVYVQVNDQPAVTAHVEIWPFELPALELPVTNWFYSDALCDRYRVEPFTPRYWDLLGSYFRNLVDHNQTAIYTPLFTPPLDDKKR